MITKVEIKNHNIIKDGIYNVYDLEGKLMLNMLDFGIKDIGFEDFQNNMVSIFLGDKEYKKLA